MSKRTKQAKPSRAEKIIEKAEEAVENSLEGTNFINENITPPQLMSSLNEDLNKNYNTLTTSTVEYAQCVSECMAISQKTFQDITNNLTLFNFKSFDTELECTKDLIECSSYEDFINWSEKTFNKTLKKITDEADRNLKLSSEASKNITKKMSSANKKSVEKVSKLIEKFQP